MEKFRGHYTYFGFFGPGLLKYPALKSGDFDPG